MLRRLCHTIPSALTRQIKSTRRLYRGHRMVLFPGIAPASFLILRLFPRMRYTVLISFSESRCRVLYAGRFRLSGTRTPVCLLSPDAVCRMLSSAADCLIRLYRILPRPHVLHRSISVISPITISPLHRPLSTGSRCACSPFRIIVRAQLQHVSSHCPWTRCPLYCEFFSIKSEFPRRQ